MKKKLPLLTALIAAALLCAEIGARVTGMVDFPLYEANATIGYIPAAKQVGAFLNKNDWQFNELHMGAAAFKSDAKANVLLVGDSLVLGGNSYKEVDRLGPRLQATISQGAKVWPISAGSWALRNELAWLRTNPDVVDKMSAVVFVVNSGDFAEASSWSCELTHPTHKPTFALGYLFEKYVYAYSPCDGRVPPALQVPPGDLPHELTAFLAGKADKVFFVWYADKSEQADAALRSAHQAPQMATLLAAGANAKNMLSVADDPRWSATFYKDSIHPLPEGNEVLAKIIHEKLLQTGLVPSQ